MAVPTRPFPEIINKEDTIEADPDTATSAQNPTVKNLEAQPEQSFQRDAASDTFPSQATLPPAPTGSADILEAHSMPHTTEISLGPCQETSASVDNFVDVSLASLDDKLHDTNSTMEDPHQTLMSTHLTLYPRSENEGHDCNTLCATATSTSVTDCTPAMIVAEGGTPSSVLGLMESASHSSAEGALKTAKDSTPVVRQQEADAVVFDNSDHSAQPVEVEVEVDEMTSQPAVDTASPPPATSDALSAASRLPASYNAGLEVTVDVQPASNSLITEDITAVTSINGFLPALEDTVADDDFALQDQDLLPSSLPTSQTSGDEDLTALLELAIDANKPATSQQSVHNLASPKSNLGAPPQVPMDVVDSAEAPKAQMSFPESMPAPCADVADDDAAIFDLELGDIYADVPMFDLSSSSPPPSSSPPLIFSSPGRSASETPPSSSPPVPPIDTQAYSATPPIEHARDNSPCCKRSLGAEEPVIATHEDQDERPTKRARIEDTSPTCIPSPPNPKRLTPASQAQQRKKLAAPFRSPVIKGPLIQGGLHAVYATGRAAPQPPVRGSCSKEDVNEENRVALKPSAGVANKDRTANAAKQFKSPLQTSTTTASAGSSSIGTASGVFSAVRAAPTIQALQGKVQTLKQAIKIKNSSKGDEEEVLEQLVEKWTSAGREVAWALWDYVKDLDPGTGPDVGAKGGWFADEDEKVGVKRGFDPSWGYDDGHAEKRARVSGGSEGGVEVEETVDEEEPAVVQHTIGVMLRRLGIDPDTLGWDEEEGDFVDRDV
ncbi:hypothetical protein C8Q76DRAFT_855298 [Earliella scabrosa]|nr:hypothetical protein C8Q76DRAFT_855298 [Earliella scabrosa]